MATYNADRHGHILRRIGKKNCILCVFSHVHGVLSSRVNTIQQTPKGMATSHAESLQRLLYSMSVVFGRDVLLFVQGVLMKKNEKRTVIWLIERGREGQRKKSGRGYCQNS